MIIQQTQRLKALVPAPHKIGDVVTIASEKLGALQNTVAFCHDAPPWKFGMTALMRNLAARKLL